jgi:hypothetical protein
MKDRVDKSMGIVTHIVETLTRIKSTEPLRSFRLLFIMNQENES